MFGKAAKALNDKSEWETITDLFVNFSKKRVPFIEKYQNTIRLIINTFLLLNQVAVCAAYGHLGATHLYNVISFAKLYIIWCKNISYHSKNNFFVKLIKKYLLMIFCNW